MHIIHLTWSLQIGGLETMLVNIMNEQIKTEKVSLIVINESFDKTLVRKINSMIKVYYLHRHLKSKQLFPYIKLNFLLLKLAPTIIHCHAPRIGMTLLPVFRKKMLWTIHDVNIDKKYFKYYSHYCSISKSVYNDVKRRIGIETPIIYNGVKVSDFRKKTIKNNKSNIFSIVQVSRLMHEKKGQHILVMALKILVDKGYNNIHVDFIGSGNSYDYLKRLIYKYGLINYITLQGEKAYTWIAEHLCDYNLVCQPSIFEGFGLTVAEGMAAMVPVLVSANEGPLEIINNGKYGFCFKNGDVEDCAIKIETIMNTDNTKLVNAAYERVYNSFNIEQTAKNYIKQYNIISGR